MSRVRVSLVRLTCLGGLLLGFCLLTGTGSLAFAGPPDLASYPWLYQRDNRPLDPTEEVVELIAVGDVMLGRGVAVVTEPLAMVTAWLSAADLTMGNLEAVIAAPGTAQPGMTTPQISRTYGVDVISSDDRSEKSLKTTPARQGIRDFSLPYRLAAAPTVINHLQAAGFDLLGLANNHAFDFGPTGLRETVTHLESAAIMPLGMVAEPEIAVQPLIRRVGPVRLAFLAFNAVRHPAGEMAESDWRLADWDEAGAVAAIKAAKAQADAVIVSIHWGQEYDLTTNPAQMAAAQVMLEAGVDVIVGHHPHVAQEAVVNADRLVLYSLGNFVFDQGFGETDEGLALRAFFDQEGLRAAQLLPVRASLRPRLMALDEAEPLLTRVQESHRLSFACNLESCRPVVDLTPPPTTGGLFWGGAIDLTGDGIPEKVRRQQEQIVIYHDGVEVWRGDAAWQVADLALGDPNYDGRWEAILALWKPDETGVRRSHPFIIGYRKGIYRDIWGGSAVVDPIYEVELGDVDGDGTQELIVLEASGQTGQRAMAVWDWHGWGFSLRWRSAPGYYRDLVFISATSTHAPLINVLEALPLQQ